MGTHPRLKRWGIVVPLDGAIFIPETQRTQRISIDVKNVTRVIIGAAIEVRRTLGPGLLESAYEECLCRELTLRQLPFERQWPLPLVYKGLRLDCGYRLDLVVDNAIIVEIKAVESLQPSTTRSY